MIPSSGQDQNKQLKHLTTLHKPANIQDLLYICFFKYTAMKCNNPSAWNNINPLPPLRVLE